MNNRQQSSDRAETPKLAQTVGKQLFASTGNSREQIRSVTQMLSQDFKNLEFKKLSGDDGLLSKNLKEYLHSTSKDAQVKKVYS